MMASRQCSISAYNWELRRTKAGVHKEELHVFHCYSLDSTTFRLQIPEHTSDHHQATNSNQDPRHSIHSNERCDQQPLGLLQVLGVYICSLVNPGEGEDQLEIFCCYLETDGAVFV